MSIRVSLQKVDAMINLVGEMVISQSKVAKIVESLDPTPVSGFARRNGVDAAQ